MKSASEYSYLITSFSGATQGSLYADNLLNSSDIFVVKIFANNGSIEWGVQFGGADSNEYCNDIVVDNHDNLVITGNLIEPVSGTSDFFVYRLSGDNGTILWTHAALGITGDEVGEGLAITSSGDIIAVGYTTGALYDANSGGKDIFMVSIGISTGTIIWSRQFGTSSHDLARYSVT
jgi:outer membrane protein assembly factor BamB